MVPDWTAWARHADFDRIPRTRNTMNANRTPIRMFRPSSKSNSWSSGGPVAECASLPDKLWTDVSALGWIACTFIAFATAPVGYAQTTNAPAGSASTPNATATNVEAVQLSPFQVTTTKDIGYASSTAMSATRTNELLENL